MSVKNRKPLVIILKHDCYGFYNRRNRTMVPDYVQRS